MISYINPGDRIPDGFIADSSLTVAGKAIEDVANHRWLMAEELVLLLMMPNLLNIQYLTNLPSCDFPLQVGKIYLLPGDSKQSMYDGIEYEKRQTEERSNTQSGIYSQLSINKQQIIEGVYSTTTSALRRRYYYMRDENERFRKVVHYRYITESELQEATNRREGKKKPNVEDEAKVVGRGRSKRTMKTSSDDLYELNNAAMFDNDEESPTNRKRASSARGNPNKTIPIHYSVLYNCYKYLFYKHVEQTTPKPSKLNSHLPVSSHFRGSVGNFPTASTTASAGGSLQYTYVKGDDEITSSKPFADQTLDSFSRVPPPHPLQPIAIQCLSPNLLTHHSLKHTQHCTIILSAPLNDDRSSGLPVDFLFEKIYQDPSMFLSDANIPREEGRMRGTGRQLTGNVFEFVVTPALSAGRWKISIIYQNLIVAHSQFDSSFLTIVEESREERFESMKRRRQKSKSEESSRRVEDLPPHAVSHTENISGNPSFPQYQYQQHSSIQSRDRLESDSSAMMTEAYSILLHRGSSQERERINSEMQTNANTRYYSMDQSYTQAEDPSSSSQIFPPSSSVAYYPVNTDINSNFDQNNLPSSEPIQAYFAEHLPLFNPLNSYSYVSPLMLADDYLDINYYSISETESGAISSATHSTRTSEGERRPDDLIFDKDHDEIVKILEKHMSIEDEVDGEEDGDL